MTENRDDYAINFADYSPDEVPEKLPDHFWAYWDMCGEFMEATEDREKGEAWMRSGAGFVRHYIWLRPARTISIDGGTR